MATHKGSEGLVKVGTDTIAEVLAWEFTETADVFEDTQLSDTSKSYLVGLKDASGTISCHWDETDSTGQTAMAIGNSITLNLYPEAAATGATYYTGTVLITSIPRSAAINGTIKATYGWQATGGLTESTVS